MSELALRGFIDQKERTDKINEWKTIRTWLIAYGSMIGVNQSFIQGLINEANEEHKKIEPFLILKNQNVV